MGNAATAATGPILTVPIATLLVGLIGAFITILGWIAAHLFTADRDRKARVESAERADRVKRLELLLQHASAQISQFYGPVHGLVHQIWATWDVKQQFNGKLDAETAAAMGHYVGEKFFADYHERIRKLIRDNMHLIEGATIPDSFYAYIKHSMMEHIQISLWNERRIDTSCVPGLPWVVEFPRDVERGLKEAIARYDAIIGELRHDRASQSGAELAASSAAAR